MIDEKKLIEWLKGKKYITVNENSTEMTEEYEKDHQWELSRNCFINKVINFIDEQPKVGEWIPCSERLPEGCSDAEIELLISTHEAYPDALFEETGFALYYPKTKSFHSVYGNRLEITEIVTAWQYLPEPYMRKKVTE